MLTDHIPPYTRASLCRVESIEDSNTVDNERLSRLDSHKSVRPRINNFAGRVGQDGFAMRRRARCACVEVALYEEGFGDAVSGKTHCSCDNSARIAQHPHNFLPTWRGHLIRA